jgi:hypothetical protein
MSLAQTKLFSVDSKNPDSPPGMEHRKKLGSIPLGWRLDSIRFQIEMQKTTQPSGKFAPSVGHRKVMQQQNSPD